MKQLKKVSKIILPRFIWHYLSEIKQKRKRLEPFYYDSIRYYKYSASVDCYTSEQLLGNIIKVYHVIEKGLTMPDRRLGFGQDRILLLCDACNKYIDQYGVSNTQLLHAIGVLSEYKQLHDDSNYVLLPKVVQAVEGLNHRCNVSSTSQIEMNKEVYFESVRSDFFTFSNSRSSVRNYSLQNISIDRLISAIDLARNTPSACNRQSWRTYIYSSKEKMKYILDVQGGNRGFGHLANKLIVITSELGVFAGSLERNQAFIDGGMYAMNLLYALHYNKIACCILNCSNSKEKDIQLREICGIKDSEVFIAMITCGIPPANFKIATSARYESSVTNTIAD